MSDNKNINNPPERAQSEVPEGNIAACEVSSVAGSVKTSKTSQRISSSSERQIKFERAQKCLENAALVSKRIKEHRKATAELLGRPFEDDDVGDTPSEMASTMSERTGYSAATDISTTLSVQDALNIPGISESLANTLKQKELLMERIKQYKEISKRPIVKQTVTRRESATPDSKSEIKSSSAKDVTDLINSVRDKENLLSIMQVRMKAMETTILDLQEKINEKDQIIEAKNKATTLMSDSLSKKEKDSLSLLEDTKVQMTAMQENFITMESEWKDEKQRLLNELEQKDEKINSLLEANTILENSRFEISVAHSKLLEELELKNKQITELEVQMQRLAEKHEKISEEILPEKEVFEEEKGSREIADMLELTKKIELLEQLNCQIRQTNKELEMKLSATNLEPKSAGGSPSKKASPLPTRKGGRNTASKMKSPWSNVSSETLHQDTDKKINKNEITRLESLVQSLNKDILEKEYEISQKDALILELQKETKEPTIDMVDSAVNTEVDEVETTVHVTEVAKGSELSEKREVDDDMSTDIIELQEKLRAAEEKISQLNNEIDGANKNMIKVKSNHKLKLKQLQKTIDNFSKVSDANAEIVKLNEELHQLSQKVAELEEEKGNLQLHLVDYDSGRLTESDIYKKMVETENLAEARLKSISVLETQKFDLVQELHILQQKNLEMEDKIADISHLQNEQVCSEMKSVQLEEQIDNLSASKKELELITQNLKLEKEHLNGTIKLLQEEKEDLMQKLETYIQENMELTDKLDKLSAEKVSSAESIEIVESLTTQEKLELEEYNKGVTDEKSEEDRRDNLSPQCDQNIDSLMEQTIELNKKIDLFTQEREEVMEKMSKISAENELLHVKISDLNNQCSALQDDIDLFNKEKIELQELNQDLNRHIDELKRERIDIMKDSIEIPKPALLVGEESGESGTTEAPHDDKSGDKGINRTKTVKQLTKEILKLKNIIKEREDEIGDCQMKILSLEEQQQKQNELLQFNTSIENKLKTISNENRQLKDELNSLRQNKEFEEQLLQYQQANGALQQEIQKLHNEYAITVNTRDARINELETLLVEYEKQVYNYGNTIQQKDKELSEYINQITKLNDVSQKLKSTIELLEEEKAKDQNAELVKNLNKQIAVCQKKLTEIEEKSRILEEEKTQLLSVKGALESKNIGLDSELKRLQEALSEKQMLIKDLQTQQQKHSDELNTIILQTKERDEEINEIKLQLRKESIENEKLRNTLSEKENREIELKQLLDESNTKLNNLSSETDNSKEQFIALETKNRELMEKLKKFAINIKKKSAMYAELETNLHETQKQLEAKNDQMDQLLIQVDTLPALQDKLKHADEEINRLQSQRLSFDQQKSRDIERLQIEINTLQEKCDKSADELSEISDACNVLRKELHLAHEEKANMKSQIDILSNKLVEYEIEQKNNMNLSTKLSALEADIAQKQNQISELLSSLEYHEQQKNQVQFGYDAKVQERDMYIENLETEISKYKNRICRLEETISVMENRRNSLERKADQLDSQLQDKQKAYSEYTSQEDELVGRLAVLMDHDRVVEKQLHEIDSENKEMQYKIQHFNAKNQRLRKALSDIQEHCNTLVEKASKTDSLESELSNCQSQLREAESNLKHVNHEHQLLLVKRRQEIEELEHEFNTQIENAIKEKKVLSEKYEKMNEHVIRIEENLQEYRNNNEILNRNIEELSRINQELVEKSSKKEEVVAPDYTEQYISEINRLNSLINNKSEIIDDLNNKMQILQSNNLSVTSDLNGKIMDLTGKLSEMSREIEGLLQQNDSLKQQNGNLQSLLSQKEEHLKDLMDNKKLTFEMTIPKTEGMIISSTIEPLNEPRGIDMSALESEIIADVDTHHQDIEKRDKVISEQMQKQYFADVDSEAVNEPVMVAKKAYLCYKKDDATEEPPPETDPFNSDEGWGLGECEEIGDVTPGLSRLNDQIIQLKKDNEALKVDLETSNTKLLKALRKLKELKSSNDVLSNELSLARQMSSSSFLDTAIEDELRIKIQELEKKLDEINTELSKEKREKEAIKKQNEVFNNASDRLTEIKEKLENEIELWKYKFKEANDKVSTLQWEGDAKDSPRREQNLPGSNLDENRMKEAIMKIENENDELQATIDQLTKQNQELTSQQSQLKNNINVLNDKLQQYESSSESSDLKNQLAELQSHNTVLRKNNEELNQKLQDIEITYNETAKSFETFKLNSEKNQSDLESSNKQLNEKCSKFEDDLVNLQQSLDETNNTALSLTAELETAKAMLKEYEEQQGNNAINNVDMLALKQKCDEMEKDSIALRSELEESKNKVTDLENVNRELEDKCAAYQEQISELNIKINNLNVENDNLLSSVAELRSSMSSAVDQRGFEIAELWKQHLAQREADFQNIEMELRTQISAAEAKYEQLLDSVQSSTQEETNKLIIMEQANSLQSKLQDKEEHLHSLQDKYTEVISQLDMLRSEIEDEKITHGNKLLEQQEEYERLVSELRLENATDSETYVQTFQDIKTELAQYKAKNDELNQRVEELQRKLTESEANIVDVTNQLRFKDTEVYQKTQEYSIVLAQRNEEFENVRKQLIEYEKRIEELSFEKESELAVLRLKMHENGTDFSKLRQEIESEKTSLAEELTKKIQECTNLNKKITDLNLSLEEQSNKASEMQSALENQEIEIVALKDEIYDLQSMLKSSSSKIEKHVSFASDTKPGSDNERAETSMHKEFVDAVPRPELDLALYMLHQRDVRCEELTMELTQLLEERDTLQLRLSDCLRSNEDLKARCQALGLDDTIDSSQETISELPSFTVEKEFVDTHRGQTSRSSSISDPDGDKPKLQAKLSELRSVRHSRDVRLRNDSEQRQLDLRLLQRDVANLPPEAVEHLTQAHHTLSRDSQSTPTVLLNWLRGKSTPKVVHM